MKLPGTATQPEVIHIAMGKLAIEPGQVFLDAGCGSGAVSLAASRFTDKIYGIDRRDAAVEASSALVPGGTFLLGAVEEMLPRLPAVDRCFIGGTRNIESFLPMLLQKAEPGFMVVADAARIGTAAVIADLMKDHGIYRELMQIQINRGYDLAGGIALKSVNPVFMVVGGC